MLAQNFKTPADLGISDVEFDALLGVLGMLERAEIDQKFRMTMWLIEGESLDCGTEGCIAGWAYAVSNKAAFADIIESKVWEDPRENERLWALLHPNFEIAIRAKSKAGAIALRNYLTHGEARWAEALAE